MIYLTDEIHLYEQLAVVENYGLAGGAYRTVRDCATGVVRSISPLEYALCRIIEKPRP